MSEGGVSCSLIPGVLVNDEPNQTLTVSWLR